MKSISESGLALIKSFESCRLTAYDDLQPKVTLTSKTKIIGTLTIGWGHTGNVSIGQTITQQEADKLLINDLTKAITYVSNPNFVPLIDLLNQNQFDALVSFCFNCGQGNLKTLCANRTIPQIALKMLEYNKSKGTTLSGLSRRRQAEKQLFEKELIITEKDYATRIAELEEIVKGLESKLAEIPPPDWFIKEFPDALEFINQKSGNIIFWRSVTVALRILHK